VRNNLEGSRLNIEQTVAQISLRRDRQPAAGELSVRDDDVVKVDDQLLSVVNHRRAIGLQFRQARCGRAQISSFCMARPFE
jgi:hypothetical protein